MPRARRCSQGLCIGKAQPDWEGLCLVRLPLGSQTPDGLEAARFAAHHAWARWVLSIVALCEHPALVWELEQRAEGGEDREPPCAEADQRHGMRQWSAKPLLLPVHKEVVVYNKCDCSDPGSLGGGVPWAERAFQIGNGAAGISTPLHLTAKASRIRATPCY